MQSSFEGVASSDGAALPIRDHARSNRPRAERIGGPQRACGKSPQLAGVFATFAARMTDRQLVAEQALSRTLGSLLETPGPGLRLPSRVFQSAQQDRRVARVAIRTSAAARDRNALHHVHTRADARTF